MRIMPCGDSNIAAVNPATPADVAHWYGFRYRLKALLEAQGVPVDFVGSCSTGWVNMADCECEYWPGQGISQLAARVTAGMLATYSPDVMILLIGTNDIRDPGTGILVSDAQAAVVVTAYRALVAQIIAARPSMWLVILNPGTPIGGSMPIFRAGVLQCYTDQQAAGNRVAYADAQDAASDGLHYSAAGHETIAARLAPVIVGLADLNIPVPALPVAPTAPVRVPAQATKVWSPQCFLNGRTHAPAGYGFGRAVALSPDGQRLFVGENDAVREYKVDPANEFGWAKVGAVFSDGQWPQQMQALASDGELYVGDFTLNDGLSGDPTYLYGSVRRATYSVDHYVADPAWFDAPEYAPCPATKDAYGFYGFAVALSSDGLWMAVGQPGLDGRNLGGALLAAGYGAVYVFTRASTSDPWTFDSLPVKNDTPVAVPPYTGSMQPDPDNWREGDFWGCALALSTDGCRLIVGETGDPYDWFAGNVYVMERATTGSPWAVRQAIIGSEVEQPSDYLNRNFGWAVCGTPTLSRIFISAPYADNDRGTYRGTVFIFEADEGAGPGEDRYTQTDRIISPITSYGTLPLPNPRWVRGFGASLSCDATGDLLAVGASNVLLRGVDFDQPIDPLDDNTEGDVFVWAYEDIPADTFDPMAPPEPEDQQYASDEGLALLYPYRPLVPVTEALAWTTDDVEAYTGTEYRRGARQIPRQSWDWRVLVQDRAWYALHRGWMTQPFYVPAWHEGMIYSGAITGGDLTLTVPATVTDYGEWRGQLAIWYAPNFCELVGIDSIDGDTITLSTAVLKTYPAGATVMPARLCRMGNLVQGQDAKGFTLLDLSWVILDAECLEPFQLDEAELLTKLPVAQDGLLDRELASVQAETDYGTGVLGFDSRREETQWGFQCLQYYTTRAEAWAFKLWLYGLQGRRGGFWIPTGKSDLLVAAPALATDTEITIERLNDYAWLFSQVTTDRYLYFQRPGLLDPIVRAVTDVQPAVGDLETVTLDEALGVAVEPGTFPYISWLHPVRLAADRIELSWEAPDHLSVTVPVFEVDPDSHIE